MNAILFAIFNPEQNCIKVQLLPYIETTVKTGSRLDADRVFSPGKSESKRALSVPCDSIEWLLQQTLSETPI